jgi:rare lipoprotein A
MNTRLGVRAGFRVALLAACLGLTGTAYAATGGTSQAQAGEDATARAGDRHVRLGSSVRVHGTLSPPEAGRTVRLQLGVGRGWHTVERARTAADGSFAASWRPERPGAFRLRVVADGDGANGSVSDRLERRVYVYRQSYASWYGPGFYGRRTACGRTITAGTLGVANKSLPCGTRVTFRHRGRSVTVPVIDRGPYAGGREWDLTEATKERLGFGQIGTVWTTR